MIGVDSEDLFPSFAAGVFEVAVNVLERLVDLLVGFAIYLIRLGVPTAWGVGEDAYPAWET